MPLSADRSPPTVAKIERQMHSQWQGQYAARTMANKVTSALCDSVLQPRFVYKHPMITISYLSISENSGAISSHTSQKSPAWVRCRTDPPIFTTMIAIVQPLVFQFCSFFSAHGGPSDVLYFLVGSDEDGRSTPPARVVKFMEESGLMRPVRGGGALRITDKGQEEAWNCGAGGVGSFMCLRSCGGG